MREVRKAKETETQAIIDLHADTIRKINSRDYSQAQVEMWIGTRSIEITQSMIENGEYCVCVDHTGNLLGQVHLKKNEISRGGSRWSRLFNIRGEARQR